MKKAIFITGATGFVGTAVVWLVIEKTEQPLIILVRGKDDKEAFHRLTRIWWNMPELTKEIGSRIQILCGDVTLTNFGLSETKYQELILSVDTILHLAADINVMKTLEELRKTNVTGVSNLLALAYAIHDQHGLHRFSYVSTAYVAGKRKGVVREEDLTDHFGFANSYEHSKYEAEVLVRDASNVLPVTIFRPGMIVGDSISGAIKTFNTIYFPLRLYLTGKLRVFPVNPSMRINLVPCDYVALAIVKLTFLEQALGKCFHLTLPSESLPTVKEMIQFTKAWASTTLHVKLPKPIFFPVPVHHLQGLSRIITKKRTIRSLLALSPYFTEKREYRRDNLDQWLGSYQGSWHDFFANILKYAVEQGFMHQTERTVHEQVFYRMQKKSRPCEYYDIVNGKMIKRASSQVREEVINIIDSLKGLGIQPGDRVAIVGYNSSRYLSIDLAIGLSEAISVPLYYSSPVKEIIEILDSCDANLFFVGVPAILEQLGTIKNKVQVVSFCREEKKEHKEKKEKKEKNEKKEKKEKNEKKEQYLSWLDFIKLGQSEKQYSKTIDNAPRRKETIVPVQVDNKGEFLGFDSTATIRYTSGTTGRPKGAVFDHSNLRYMAMSLASLPPWKARTKKIVYLSFLPMNHVVEGILATYALYYAPAPVEVYYLENFHDLQAVLPKVRPTIFFSVPRFYEKVWEQAQHSLVGRLYQKRKEGLTKRFLAHLLRYGIRRAAGISRCAQLIVGSAPISQELLMNYQRIGIEIHNAYGLTEAPLITLNRYKRNQIDTVGEALPNTEIMIAKDGEVLVRGPQVMKGYYQEVVSPVTAGWLQTGDLGSLCDENYLKLLGRKKEVIINSYGKNINPAKIELLLREITGVNHLILCGDKLPYCTALFWVGDNIVDADFLQFIKQSVKEANRELSHPEQVKKWAVLPEELSIETGELTANLKIKRTALLSKYNEVIDALYNNLAITDVYLGSLD